jgi:hypothetical protein
MATSPTTAYIVTSRCQIGHPEFTCDEPTTVWQAPVDGGPWTQVPLTLPVALAAVVELHGPTVYVLLPRLYPDPDLLFVTTDGVTWEPRTEPCDKALNEILVDVAPISDTEVGLLCIGDPGFSQSFKRVFRSHNTGRTTFPAGKAPLLGIQSEIAAAPDGTMAISSVSSGSWIYRRAPGGDWTTPLAIADGGQGWSDLSFVDDATAFVIHAPGLFPDRAGELLVSHDGGNDWEPVSFAALPFGE